MEVEATNSKVSVDADKAVKERVHVKLKKETLKAVLEECQRALESLSNGEGLDEEDDEEGGDVVDDVVTDAESSGEGSSSSNREADELCDLIKSKFECKDFLEKLGSTRTPVSQNSPEEGSSWDMITENDLWEGESIDGAEEEYVVVSQDDIVEGIACFMAAYLLSLKQTKDLTPNQLQEVLSKTFAVKKKKGKLRKAWDGSKVIYNVASWGATAIGIYQNPALLKAASDAFWASFRVISKLL